MSLLELLLLLIAIGGFLWAFWLRAQRRDQAAQHARELAAEKAQHEVALQAEAKRIAAIFDRMIEAVIIVGTDGHIRLANRAAVALFNTGGSMVGRTVLEATRHHEVAAVVRRLDEKPEVLGHEVRLERVGEARLVHINALALVGAEGTRDGALLVFHDLTRLRQLESVRQDFVANVSHELRTPLSLIKSATETLIDGGKHVPAVTDRFLDIIDKNANRLTLLIDDLLLLAKLDSGRVQLHIETLELHQAAQEALDDAALLARAREVRLRNDVPPKLLGAADSERLRQVLANLIDNAIKYGRHGGEVVLLGRNVDSRTIELAVRDDGPGIPPDAKARVFERFYRVDKARDRAQGGTGLGLAIVKNVIEAHGGDVRVESTPGAGTTFYFTLRTPEAMAALRN
jgi:two-component system phosphate regulon sensor histidine kinase PhoR